MTPDNPIVKVSMLAASTALFVAGCGRRHIEGRIDADDGRVGVPCVIERVERGYNPPRVVGTLRTETGRTFSGELVRPPGQTLLHPTSGENDLVVRCDGYVPN